MKLVIEDIYSPDGIRMLAEACSKGFWAKSVHATLQWFGVPIVQFSEDLLMMAEVMFKAKPDLVVECGIYRGGGLAFYASLLELLGHGEILGIDVNSAPDLSHVPGAKRIGFIQGDDSSDGIFREVQRRADGKNVLVVLDSDHSKNHVAQQLTLYSTLIRPGGYLVAMDGIMKILHDVPGGENSWQADNPETAIEEFLDAHQEFERDLSLNRLKITCSPGGFLRRKE